MSLLCSTYLDMADQQTWQSQSDFTSSRSLQNCRTFCFYIPIFQPATKSPFQIFMAHRPPKHGVVSFEDLLPVETEPYAASSIPDSHGLPWIPMNCHTSRNALVRRARMTWAKCGSCRFGCSDLPFYTGNKHVQWFCPKPKGPSPHSNVTMLKKNRYLAVTGQTFCLDLYHFCHPNISQPMSSDIPAQGL